MVPDAVIKTLTTDDGIITILIILLFLLFF